MQQIKRAAHAHPRGVFAEPQPCADLGKRPILEKPQPYGITLGVAQFLLAIQFAPRGTLETARVLFYGSIVYLPLLWALMAIGKR